MERKKLKQKRLIELYVFCSFQLLQTRLQVLEQQGDKKGKAVITPNSDSAPNVKLETNSHTG